MLDVKKTAVRAASGAVYVILIILACLWGDLGVTLLAGILGALGVSEFRRMRFAASAGGGIAAYDIAGALALIFLPIPSAIFPLPFALIWIIWLIGRMIITVFSRRQSPEKEFAVDMAAQLYIALPLAIMVASGLFLQRTEDTCLPLLSLFVIIWVNDTGAYLFGSIFGRHKLFERVSPKKSWEGFWGGLACTVATGVLVGVSDSPMGAVNVCCPILFWALAGLIISLASTFGDLFESVIKRNLHIKDSGNLIPGHGGILDRIDSLLMVLPASLIYYIFYRLLSEII